jgi:hypothetical protein
MLVQLKLGCHRVADNVFSLCVRVELEALSFQKNKQMSG